MLTPPQGLKNTTTIDFGLSDFHKMILTSFRFQYKPGAPKITYYRSYKSFDKQKFKDELQIAMNEGLVNNYEEFESKFKNLRKACTIEKENS